MQQYPVAVRASPNPPKLRGDNRMLMMARGQYQPLTVDADGVADLLGISRRTVYRLWSARKIPSPIELGGRTLWRRADIEQFVEAGSMATLRRRRSS